MRIAIRLNDIEQEHLQEVYNAAGVARDELPYSEQFDQICQDFQDRTFKNAEKEQVYAAMLKYMRSSTCSAAEEATPALEPAAAKLLREVIRRHAKGGRILPYSSEFDGAMTEFNRMAGKTLTEREFWRTLCRLQSRSARPPRRAVKQVKEEEEAEEVE